MGGGDVFTWTGGTKLEGVVVEVVKDEVIEVVASPPRGEEVCDGI